jgi:hypothetical protein
MLLVILTDELGLERHWRLWGKTCQMAFLYILTVLNKVDIKETDYFITNVLKLEKLL